MLHTLGALSYVLMLNIFILHVHLYDAHFSLRVDLQGYIS